MQKKDENRTKERREEWGDGVEMREGLGGGGGRGGRRNKTMKVFIIVSTTFDQSAGNGRQRCRGLVGKDKMPCVSIYSSAHVKETACRREHVSAARRFKTPNFRSR